MLASVYSCRVMVKVYLLLVCVEDGFSQIQSHNCNYNDAYRDTIYMNLCPSLLNKLIPYTYRSNNPGGEKLGKFGKINIIHQYFTHILPS